MTIRSMHALGTHATQAAKQKSRALAIAFASSLLWRIVSQYAPGIMWDWHIFLWFFQWSGYTNHAIHIENWGWMIQWTPAFIGTGLLVGLNPAFSFFGGSILAWGKPVFFNVSGTLTDLLQELLDLLLSMPTSASAPATPPTPTIPNGTKP